MGVENNTKVSGASGPLPVAAGTSSAASPSPAGAPPKPAGAKMKGDQNVSAGGVGGSGLTLPATPSAPPAKTPAENRPDFGKNDAAAAAFDKLTTGERQEFVHVRDRLADADARQALDDGLARGKFTGQPKDAEGKTVLQRLDQLSRQEVVSPLTTQGVLGDVVKDIANPERIDQGPNRTCATTSAQYLTADQDPAEYGRLIGGLASKDGSVKMRGDGGTQPSLIRVPGSESAGKVRGDYIGPGKAPSSPSIKDLRDHKDQYTWDKDTRPSTSRLFQSAATEFVNNMRDSNGKVPDSPVTYDPAMDVSYNAKDGGDAHGGIYSSAEGFLLSKLSGKSQQTIAETPAGGLSARVAARTRTGYGVPVTLRDPNAAPGTTSHEEVVVRVDGNGVLLKNPQDPGYQRMSRPEFDKKLRNATLPDDRP